MSDVNRAYFRRIDGFIAMEEASRKLSLKIIRLTDGNIDPFFDQLETIADEFLV